MIFLVEYNRKKGKLVQLRAFSHWKTAFKARWRLEIINKRKGFPHEIVFLEAESVEALKKTHGRYFYSPEEMARKFMEELLNPGGQHV